MIEFYIIFTLAFLYIAFMGGVIGYLIGKYWEKKQLMKREIKFKAKRLDNGEWCEGLCGKRFRGGMMPLGVTVGNCYIYVVGNKFDNGSSV